MRQQKPPPPWITVAWHVIVWFSFVGFWALVAQVAVGVLR